MKKTKQNSRFYPKTLKRKIAQEYLAGKFSYAVAAEEYGLKNKDVVKEFVRWYKKSGYLEQMDTVSEQSELLSTDTSSEREQVLAAELAAAKLKISSLETLIDLAESELQIDIRKKSGTKQSK